jgi:hypothetical protein
MDTGLITDVYSDHFDDKVEAELRRDLPIISTPHARSHLASKSGTEAFTSVYALDHHETGILMLGETTAAIRVMAVPGKHVPPGPGHLLEKANDLLGAVPPTNGWIVELGSWDKIKGEDGWQKGYRIYISGDTLIIPELKDVAERYKHLGGVDLMLVHLGRNGTVCGVKGTIH